MNTTAMKLLQYDKIKETLASYAVSEMAKERIVKLEPSTDLQVIRGWLEETTEGRNIANRSSGIPVDSLNGIGKITAKLGKGGVLQPDELEGILRLLENGRKLKTFMESRRDIAPRVSSYSCSIYELQDLAEEIGRCICNGRVDDRASSDLSKIRKKIAILEDRITSKLESILRSPAYSSCIQDAVVSMKSGVYVIPVKREYRRNIEGTVVDTSSSGSTVFIEPEGVKRLREELSLLRFEQEKEEYRILSYLTGMAESYQKEISINIETMVHYDFVFAKAKYSKAIEGSSVHLNTDNFIDIRGAKHPLIGRSAVPLDFSLGKGYRALVITGPNTGGKTVALKTVGLLTMMAQSGLHVPLEEDCELAVFRDILVDIGDGQSIEQSLSTFSSHIRNIISILECADPYTLVIIDELGTGTDPAEGMGIAIAVMEEIYTKGASLLATTHYSEIKEFAAQKDGFENGCMEFDINTLKPLYRLRIGKPGESNAFLISLRLGMSRKIIERAHEVTYKERREYAAPPENMPAEPLKNAEVVYAHARQLEQVKRSEEIRKKVEQQKIEPSFKLGDCVFISTMNRTGIVCETENHKGEVTVMVMKNRFKVNKKRLSLYVEGKELYPEDYDFDVIFDSKENRKKKKVMNKRHEEGVMIERTVESR